MKINLFNYPFLRFLCFQSLIVFSSLLFLALMQSPLQASSTYPEELEARTEKIKRQARHLVRPSVRQKVYHYWMSPERKWRSFRGTLLKEIDAALYSEGMVECLNRNIINILKGEEVHFLGCKNAFEGTKDLLEARGFYLKDDYLEKRKPLTILP